MCLLREQGQSGLANELSNGALAEMIAALRSTTDNAEALTARLEAILAAETERVANASVLAALLAPMLVRHIAPGSPGVAATLDPVVAAVARTAPPARTVPATIADFIDEMIAHEVSRPSPPAARRAS